MLLNRKAQFCSDVHFSILIYAIDAIPINILSFLELNDSKVHDERMAKNNRENAFKDN